MRKIMFCILLGASSQAFAGAGPIFTDHRVQPNETLSGLSERYHCSVSAIVSANPGINPGKIRAGALIHIPQNGEKTTPQSSANVVQPYGSLIMQKRYQELLTLAKNDENITLIDLRQVKATNAYAEADQ